MKRKRLIISIITLMVIGFAAVSTTLIINGTLNIASNKEDFNVYFSKAYENGIENNDLIVDDTHIEFDVYFTEIDEEYELKYEVTNGSKNYDGEISLDIPEDTEYYSITNEFNADALLARTSREGILTIKLTKAVTEDVEVPLELSINVNAIERTSLGTDETELFPEPSAVSVLTGNGTNLGDEIAIGDEHFYVLSNDGESITMLAKYNLEVGNSSNSSYPTDEETNIQSETSYATVKFGSSNEYLGSIVEGYINRYVEILKEKYNLEASGRLIMWMDLEDLAGEEIQFQEVPLEIYSSIPPWLYSTNYWMDGAVNYITEDDLGNIVDIRYKVLAVSWASLSIMDYSNDDSLGVRPVITISADLI